LELILNKYYQVDEVFSVHYFFHEPYAVKKVAKNRFYFADLD